MTRRGALCAIGATALAAARPFAQDAPLEFAAIDHIEFYVSQVDRTRDFFAAVFGNTLLKNTSASKNYPQARIVLYSPSNGHAPRADR